MVANRKIILHSLRGHRPGLDDLVAAWIRDGVRYVGVVGVNASHIEDLIDEMCIGDGSSPYSMLTASHDPDETVADAIALADQLTDEFAGPSTVIEF